MWYYLERPSSLTFNLFFQFWVESVSPLHPFLLSSLPSLPLCPPLSVCLFFYVCEFVYFLCMCERMSLVFSLYVYIPWNVSLSTYWNHIDSHGQLAGASFLNPQYKILIESLCQLWIMHHFADGFLMVFFFLVYIYSFSTLEVFFFFYTFTISSMYILVKELFLIFKLWICVF